jgi:hypothetical protein
VFNFKCGSRVMVVTRAGQDIPEQSLRDVFNDVSKYIRNISISLNAVFP